MWVVDNTKEEGAVPSNWIQERCACWPLKSLKHKTQSKMLEIVIHKTGYLKCFLHEKGEKASGNYLRGHP